MEKSRRSRKRDRTKQAILDSALALFAERGIYEPSIEEITDRADLGKGTFYQYFASRDELIAELVKGGIDGLLRHLDQEFSEAGGEDEILGRVFSVHGRYFHDHPEHLLLLHQARGRMKLPTGGQGAIYDEFARYTAQLERYIPPGPGELAATSPRRQRMALVLGGFISGALSFKYLFGGGLEAMLELPNDALLFGALVVP